MTSPDGNGASGAFSTGPASEYNLIHLCLYLFLFIRCLNLNTAAYLFLFISCLNLNTSTYYLVTESLNIVIIIFYMFNFGIKIYRNMPRILTIQKPYIVDRLSVSSFAASIKPNVFDGSNYKRWREWLTLWLTAMNVMHVVAGKPEGSTPEDANAFDRADSFFPGAIISVLVENLIDTYLSLPTGKEMWETLEAQFGVSEAGSELYLMEQFLDHKMVEDRPIIEQVHEIQALSKYLKDCSKEIPCVLPDKFVAGAIISKLPPSWRDFATSLKHKRKEFSISDLIGTLDVEEKARAKDTRGKGIVGA